MNRHIIPARPRAQLVCLLSMVLLLATVTASPASTVLALDVDDLTDRSQQIFHGTCIDAGSAIESGNVVTRLRFAVAEGLKGSGSDTLDVVLPGGLMHGQRYSISGMPEFAVGQEVVLFLSAPDASGRVWPTGLAQGGFHVQRDSDGSARVRRDHSGLAFHGSARPVAQPAQDMNLDDLLSAVRTQMGQSDGEPR